MRTPALTPVFLGENFNVFAHLVFAAHGDNVDTVIIDGKMVMEHREMLTVDEEEVIDEATRAANRVIQHRKES
jgi:5-methylthioadenosine/S-adenosylhomocysteine deaminase